MPRFCRHRPLNRETIELAGMDFTGPDYGRWWVEGGFCEYGFCFEFSCPVCDCTRVSIGPINCPCDDLIGYRDMRRKRPVAVKPSVAGRKPSRRRH